MITLLKILGLLAALLLGIRLGLGHFRQDPRDIERALGEKRRRKRVHRHFTPLDLLKPRERSSRGEGRSRFRTAAPERRDEGAEEDGGEARREDGPG